MIDVVVKLLLAIALGGAVGIEREFSQKPAGLRTNILICLGSTMMMALSGVVLAGKGMATGDSLRIAAGVITGMGFIGAGTIIRASGHVHGLTTASTLWAVTGLGLVIGAGYYALALIFTASVIFTLVLFRRIEKILPRRTVYQLVFKIKDHPGFLGELRREASRHGLRLEDVCVRRNETGVSVSFEFVAKDGALAAFTEALGAIGTVDVLRVL